MRDCGKRGYEGQLFMAVGKRKGEVKESRAGAVTVPVPCEREPPAPPRSRHAISGTR